MGKQNRDKSAETEDIHARLSQTPNPNSFAAGNKCHRIVIAICAGTTQWQRNWSRAERVDHVKISMQDSRPLSSIIYSRSSTESQPLSPTNTKTSTQSLTSHIKILLNTIKHICVQPHVVAIMNYEVYISLEE